MEFLKNLLSVIFSVGYSYNATIEQIYNSNENINNLFISSVNDYCDKITVETIDPNSHPYHTRANILISQYKAKNQNVGLLLAKQLGSYTIATSSLVESGNPIIDENLWRIMQGWCLAVYNSDVIFLLNGGGGLVHVSMLDTDVLLENLGYDVEACKNEVGNTGYELINSVWNYLRSNANFSVNTNLFIVDEYDKLSYYNRSIPSMAFIYPTAASTTETISLPYGNTSVRVGLYDNTDTPGMKLVQGLDNKDYPIYLFLKENDEPLYCQYLSVQYTYSEGKKVMKGVQNSINTRGYSEGTTRNKANNISAWIETAPCSSSFINSDVSRAVMKDESGELNAQGLWDVITSSNVISENGDIRGDYTFYIPSDIQDVLYGVNSGDLTVSYGLKKIGCYAVNTETKRDITGDLTYAQIKNEIQNNGDNPALPEVPTTQASTAGLFAMFNPTKEEVSQLGEYLWSGNIFDTIKKGLADPMDVIISLSLVPVKPITGKKQKIKIAFIESDISANKITSQYVTVNMGSIYIGEKYGNFLDYNPYTEVSLYLPFIGAVSLDTDVVMNSTLSIVYNIDLLSGAFSCNLNVKNKTLNAVMFEYGGTMAQQLPLTGANYANLYGSIASAVGGIAAAPLTAGAALSGTLGVLSSKVGISHSGGVGGVTGFLSGFEAYAIIKRPVPYESGGYNSMKGKPCGVVRTFGGLSGYTEAENCLLNITGATSEEISEIRELLASGVYF